MIKENSTEAINRVYNLCNNIILNKDNIKVKFGILGKMIQLFYYTNENYKKIKIRNNRRKAIKVSQIYYCHKSRYKNDYEIKKELLKVYNEDIKEINKMIN